MSYFLWIEDFESSPKVTADEVFGGIDLGMTLFPDQKEQLKQDLKTKGVFVELSFQDGLEFIHNHLGGIDYIILDIDLIPYLEDDPINENFLALLNEFHHYDLQENLQEVEQRQQLKSKCDELKLKAIAGYYLYTELIVEQGFPKQHILFCSNHGDTTLQIQEAFESAKIKLPSIYTKSDSYVQKWVKDKYDDPYSRLRRGIIEGCRYLKSLGDEKLRFKDFIKDAEKPVSIEDFHNYLDVLEQFLPLAAQANTATLYKLFIRILAHEWEATEPQLINRQNKQNGLYAFCWIMKMSRNWLAHGKAFEKLTAQDVAYLFIVNMRAMFDQGESLLLR